MVDEPRILDAENTLIRYAQYLQELKSPTVPRQWVEELLGHLEAVLEAHAEVLAENEAIYDPPRYEEDVEYVDPDEDNDWLKPDYGDM